PKDLGKELAKLKDQQIQALILDLRNNPGGLLSAAVGVSEQFLEPDKLIVSIKGRDGREDEYRAHPKTAPFTYPMIVLVNQGSASASEIVAAALQDWGKAVIVGTTTFGKGSVQTILPLSDGSGLRLTTAKYYTPRGESIHAVGVKPDIVVKPQAVRVAQGTQPRKSGGGTAASQEKAKQSSSGQESGKKTGEPSSALEQEDIQLQKAIELLKTWKVFKNLKVG
ncbi:MAG: peptidase S41, partial [Nitrospirae bacterium]